MVRVSPAERAEAKAKAEAWGWSVSEFGREAMAAFGWPRIALPASPTGDAIREAPPAEKPVEPGIRVVYDEDQG
jgi:hypothetical protein